MTDSQRAVLSLVRMAVSGKAQALPKDLAWHGVVKTAVKQGVNGLCFDAVEMLSPDNRPDFNNLMELIGQSQYLENIYEKYKQSITDLASFYDGEGIKMMLLKGYGLSLNWPKPNHRPIGDADTYNFGLHDFADQMISDRLGITIDNSHHKHSVFHYKGITVENHYSFLNTYGHRSSAEIEKILKGIIDEYQDEHISNLYYPSVKFNSLYLLRHSGEHFASVDLNLRQVLDWGFFVRNSNVDWDWLLSTLDKVGMKKYLAVLNRICVKYLGFEDSIFPALPVDETLVDRFLSDIIEPEVEKEKHERLVPELMFRFKRWWRNRWKHDLVYKESVWMSFFTQIWSHILKPSL